MRAVEAKADRIENLGQVKPEFDAKYQSMVQDLNELQKRLETMDKQILKNVKE